MFVDFWNYTLSMRDEAFRTDWREFGPALSCAAVAVVDTAAMCEYQGLNFHGSYDPASEAETSQVGDDSGEHVSGGERVDRSASKKCVRHPFAPLEAVATCPACGADMRGTEEKGVDVGMTTDMISLVWIDIVRLRDEFRFAWRSITI